jgi:hypothetical protein
LPREVGQKYIDELQEQLIRDDVFIPKRPARDLKNLATNVTEIFANSTSSGDVINLLNGISRDIYGEINHWQSDGFPAEVQLEWENPINLSSIEIKCDTNLKRNIMMRKDSKNDDLYGNHIPHEMLKSLTFYARVKGQWISLGNIKNNRTRLIKHQFETLITTAVKVKLTETYGAKNIKLFELRCYV